MWFIRNKYRNGKCLETFINQVTEYFLFVESNNTLVVVFYLFLKCPF